MSADGTVVAGWGNAAFRWKEATGTTRLVGHSGSQYNFLYGLSADGRWAVGASVMSANHARAICWGPTNVGVAVDSADVSSITTARDVSADAGTIVGAYSHGSTYEAYVWTDAGIQLLGVLPGSTNSQAFAVSDDGSVVAGGSGRAFVWTFETGMIDLGAYGEYSESAVAAMSPDGSVAVGYARDPSSRVEIALMWRDGVRQPPLVDIPNVYDSTARGTNRDGSVVVGQYDANYAFVWTDLTGAVDLTEYVASIGLELPGVTFVDATAISADGSTIVGEYLVNGQHRAFILRDLPLGDNRCPPCAADFDEDGGVTGADLAAFMAAYEAGARCADVDDDDQVDGQDVAAFLAAFERGGCV